MSSTHMEPTSRVAAVLKKKMSSPSMKKLRVPLPLHRTFSEYLTPPRRPSTMTSSASTELAKGDSLPNGMGDWRESWESLSPEVIRKKANRLEELADKCQRLNSVMGDIVTESREGLHEDNTLVLAKKIDSDISQTHIEYESTIQEMLEAEDALFDDLEQRLEKIERQSRSIFQ